MQRKTASDFDPEVMKLFDQYVHGAIDRREFLDRSTKYAVGGMTATMLLDALSPKFAEAQQVKNDDPRISAKYVEYASPDGSGKMRGYLASPAMAPGKLPGVLVIHENRGLNPHIEDIARRLALDNFVAFAPDALFPLGGYPGDEDKARALFAKLEQPKSRNDFIAAAGFLKALPGCTGKIGAVGFCYGGGIVNFLATRIADLGAAAPFYGPQPSNEEAAKIKAPLQVHYAENDDWVNKGWPAYETALKAAGVKFEMFKYPGTQHGFNNDTTPRYEEKQAKIAWGRTVEFFNGNLRKS
jgi:carboxymethylenebutenolidase